MSTAPGETIRVAIVGGGFAGLAAALRLGDRARESSRPVELTVFEAAGRLGGAVSTERSGGYLIERGADSVLMKPSWQELCRRLGLDDQLVPTDPRFRGALVLREGKPLRVPEGFNIMLPTRLRAVLASPVLSPAGKARLLGEAFVRQRRGDEDESLAAFAVRRLGREVFERLVQPLAAGIYTADPNKLSLSATMPRFQEMERNYGSLLRAGWATRRGSPDSAGARYHLFACPRDGMERILAAMSEAVGRLGRIQLNTPVDWLERTSNGWRVGLESGREPFEADAALLALPAFAASRLLRNVDLPLAELLGGISYASSAIVATGHRLEDVAHPLDAFGLVIPAIENRQVLAVSFASRKLPGRAPDGRVLLRTFIGGALQGELLERGDGDLIQLARSELEALLGVRGEPEVALVTRYHRGMPQYHLGHQERVARIEAALGDYAGLELAGAAYHGVGIPDVVTQANNAADRLFDSKVRSS